MREERLQTGDDDHGGEFDLEGKEISGLERAESVEKEPPTKTSVPESSLSLAQIAVQLVSRRARKNLDDIIRLGSGDTFDSV